MSNQQNDKILEEASELAEEFTGTPVGEVLDFNIKRGDLEALPRLIKEARNMLREDVYDED